MNPYIAFPLVSIGVLFLYTLASSVLTYLRHARQATKLGCKPAPRLPTRWPFGLDFMWRLIQHDSQNLLPPFTLKLYKEMGGVGTYEQNFVGITGLVTVDPKNIQAVLATQFNDFSLGATRRGNFGALLGNGIFTNDGKAWEHSRALVRPQFTRDQVSDLDSLEGHLQNLLLHLPRESSTGWTPVVNVRPPLSRLVLDAATEFLCGESVNSQVEALPNEHSEKQALHANKKDNLDWTLFAYYFDKATEGLGIRVRLFDRYWLYSPPSFRSAITNVHKFANYHVDLALNPNPSALSIAEKSGKKPKYVFLHELAKDTRDPVELRSQLLNVLLAGRDTTAGTLSWVFHTLARHPEVFDKLRKTILEDFGTYSHPKEITFASMKNCTYLQYVLNEILRLYPNVALNSRRATKDTTLPRGGGPDGSAPVYVKKGQEVNYYVFVMHRRRDLWGPDAEEFRPERWEGKKRGWEYLPFNGGPRVCLGQQFALTEAGFVIIRLLQRYDRIQNMDNDQVIRHAYGVTTTPVKVLVRLHEAEDW